MIKKDINSQYTIPRSLMNPFSNSSSTFLLLNNEFRNDEYLYGFELFGVSYADITSDIVYILKTNYYQNCSIQTQSQSQASTSTSRPAGRKRRAGGNAATTTKATTIITAATTEASTAATTGPIDGSSAAPINEPQTQSTLSNLVITTNGPTTLRVCNNYSNISSMSQTNIVTNYINRGQVMIQVIYFFKFLKASVKMKKFRPVFKCLNIYKNIKINKI